MCYSDLVSDTPTRTFTTVPAPPFCATAYEVFEGGRSVGFVASRREAFRGTLWGHAATLDTLHGAYAPSRPLAADNRSFAHRQETR